MEEVESFLRMESKRPYTDTEDRGDEVDGQQISGLQNTRRLNEVINDLGGQNGCFNEAVDDLEEVPRQCNIAFNEVGGQRQALT